jgi:hypothetical protein
MQFVVSLAKDRCDGTIRVKKSDGAEITIRICENSISYSTTEDETSLLTAIVELPEIIAHKFVYQKLTMALQKKKQKNDLHILRNQTYQQIRHDLMKSDQNIEAVLLNFRLTLLNTFPVQITYRDGSMVSFQTNDNKNVVSACFWSGDDAEEDQPLSDTDKRVVEIARAIERHGKAACDIHHEFYDAIVAMIK